MSEQDGERPAATRLSPPRGGTPPPGSVTLADGTTLVLAPVAHEICRRYRAEYPDEEERYGEAGMAWCVHDLQWILSWAAEGELGANVEWLARVLAARDFPLERLVRALQIAADMLHAELGGPSEPASALASEATALAGRL